MIRKSFCRLLRGLAAVTLICSAQAPQQKPNILVIGDDVGWFIGAYHRGSGT